MTNAIAHLTEYQESEARLQYRMNQFVESLDDRRFTVPDAVLAFIRQGQPDPEDYAIIEAWSGRVFDYRDYHPERAVRAVSLLPTHAAAVHQWWLDQINPDNDQTQLHFQAFLQNHAPTTSRTKQAAYGLIRAALAPHTALIPQFTDLPAVSGDSLAAALYHYARLRELAATVGSAELPPVPTPDQGAALLRPVRPNLKIDIGAIQDVHQMAQRDDWRDHQPEPVVCPGCDTWISCPPFAINRTNRTPCPYCPPPGFPTAPPKTNTVGHLAEFIIQELAPRPYAESNNLYTRIAAQSGLTPHQVLRILHPDQVDEPPAPAPCPIRSACPTQCAQGQYPCTHDGLHHRCSVYSFLRQTDGLSAKMTELVAQDYLDRLTKAKASQPLDDSTPEVELDDPTPAVRQPTLL